MLALSDKKKHTLTKNRKQISLQTRQVQLSESSEDENLGDTFTRKKNKRPNPKSPVILTGTTSSDWKMNELLGIFEFYQMDPKTNRPIYKVN